MQTNANVQTTSVTQTANTLLQTPEKKLYFLVIETPEGRIQINVGKKTHEMIQALTLPPHRDPITKLQFEKPQVNTK